VLLFKNPIVNNKLPVEDGVATQSLKIKYKISYLVKTEEK
jgi:hypothetical protein